VSGSMSPTPAATQGSAGKLIYDLTELVDSDDSSKKISVSNGKHHPPLKSEGHSSTSKPKLRTVTQAQKEEIAQRFGELDNEGMIQAAKLIKTGLHKFGKHELANEADKTLGAGDDIDLQLDEIPEESLHDLLRLVRKSRWKKGAADVVVLDDDDAQIVSSPFQKGQSKGTGWPLKMARVPSASSAAKAPQLAQTSSPLPAASARSSPVSSTLKPQRHSPSKLKNEVLPPRQQVLKRKPGVDIHDLTGDVEVIDLDDELPARPKKLSSHERTTIQREILGKELSNCTVAKVLFLQEQQDLSEDQLRQSLKKMRAIFDQFPATTSSLTNFKSSKDMPNYNASTRYAPTTKPSIAPATSVPVGTPQQNSIMPEVEREMIVTPPTLAEADRSKTGPSLPAHRPQSSRPISQTRPSESNSNRQRSAEHIVVQPPRKATPPARAKKNPGHGTMRMTKSKGRPGIASDKGSNAGTASPVIQPVAMPVQSVEEQLRKDASTMIPVQSIEQSATKPPSDKNISQFAMLNSGQFRRLQAPTVHRPIDSVELATHTGQTISPSSTPDPRHDDNTPDTIGSGEVAHAMQAHIEEYKLSHSSLVKVSHAEFS